VIPVVSDGNSITFHIDIPPVPASRPRVGRWGTYYGKTYKQFRERMLEWVKEWDREPITGPMDVETWIYRARPKSTTRKKHYPKGDNDNYEKAVWDSLNGVVWEDDDDIVTNHTYKRYAVEGHEQIVLTVTRLHPVTLNEKE
jgi:Holliday junction resolvase RusA-like endonuclease